MVEQVCPLIKHRTNVRIFGRTGKGLRRFGLVHGVPCERFPAGKGGKKYISAVYLRLKTLRPDLIQVENRPRFAYFLKKKMPKSRVWLYLHSTTFISKRHIGTQQLARSLRAVDRIVVNSVFLKNHIGEQFPGLKGKISVNHLGVDPDSFTSRWSKKGGQLREGWLRKHGMQGRKIILFLGRLIPMKGVHHLLRVVPDIVKEEPSALFVIVGSAFYGSKRKTPYVRKLERAAKPYSKHVRFIPYVPYDQVARWFGAADIAVVPSSAREAFGLVNVEAMAAGIPVIATRAGGMKEIVADGETGYLLDPNMLQSQLKSRLTQLLRDETLRKRLGKASAERVREQFTWQHTADRWIKMIESEVAHNTAESY